MGRRKLGLKRISVALPKEVYETLMRFSEEVKIPVSSIIAGFVPEPSIFEAVLKKKEMLRTLPQEKVDKALFGFMREFSENISKNPLMPVGFDVFLKDIDKNKKPVTDL